MSYLGDYGPSAVIYGKFNTFRPSSGGTYTLAGSPAIVVYKDNSTSPSTAGVALTVDFASVTGLHHYTISTTADSTFYAAGSQYNVILSAGTVDSVSIAGANVGAFSLRKVGLSTGTEDRIADAMLDRNMATGTDSGTTSVRTARQALRLLRNKWDTTAGTLTVYKEDDSTTSWTGSLTASSAASPITANDPAGP